MHEFEDCVKTIANLKDIDNGVYYPRMPCQLLYIKNLLLSHKGSRGQLTKD